MHVAIPTIAIPTAAIPTGTGPPSPLLPLSLPPCRPPCLPSILIHLHLLISVPLPLDPFSSPPYFSQFPLLSIHPSPPSISRTSLPFPPLPLPPLSTFIPITPLSSNIFSFHFPFPSLLPNSVRHSEGPLLTVPSLSSPYASSFSTLSPSLYSSHTPPLSPFH